MIQRLRQWRDHVLAEGALKTPARGAFAWVVSSLFVAGVVSVCALVPPIAEKTGLVFLPAVLTFLPLPALAGIDGLTRRAGFDTASRALSVVGNFCVELYPAVLIGYSRFSGAAIFAGFYLLTALFHAQLFRISARYPFWLCCFLVQAAASLGINRDDEHVAVWALLLPAACASALVAGNAKLREDQGRRSIERTRSAIAAQVLEEEAGRGRDLDEWIQDLVGIAHDLRSPLTAASLDLSALEGQLIELGHSELTSSVRTVRSSIAKVREMLQAAREEALRHQVRLESVRVLETVSNVALRCRRSYPTTPVAVDVQPELMVLVAEGADTLERVIENLVTNACEGDGISAAHNVTVSADLVGSYVAISVCDDGPGFPSAVLATGIRSYSTTKRGGTGVGLFTVDRLVRASGGELVLENAQTRGARVTVKLSKPM